MMVQRRIYKRFGFKGNVDLKTENDRKNIVRAYLDDISLSGLRMRSRDKIPVNEKVDFVITTPLSRGPLLGEGRIRHVTLIKVYENHFYYVGIQFKRIKRNRIKELINEAYVVRKKPFLSRQHRRELSFLAKISPFLILVVWMLTTAMGEINNSRSRIYGEAQRGNDSFPLSPTINKS